jgi:adenosylcobinamide-phosphate synthase
MTAWNLSFPWGLGVSVTCLAVLIALLIDRVLGEPAARWHPVVWMGGLLDRLGAHIAPLASPLPPEPDLRRFVLGALAWCLGAALVTASALALQAAILAWMPGFVAALLIGVLLKPLLAWRMLHDEVAAVEVALGVSLQAGRDRLGWLCSRDVSALSATEVRETALETLAENLNDSVVAPLFWFALGGLPAAALYRWANTADAMWGYRGERQGRIWTWAGKWAARADDVLSWVPARLTGLALMLAGRARGWSPWVRQARSTPSPNGGWPMAALALALDVRLSKPGVYTLHGQGRGPGAMDTARGLRLAGTVVGGLAACAAAVFVLSWWKGGLS